MTGPGAGCVAVGPAGAGPGTGLGAGVPDWMSPNAEPIATSGFASLGELSHQSMWTWLRCWASLAVFHQGAHCCLRPFGAPMPGVRCTYSWPFQAMYRMFSRSQLR